MTTTTLTSAESGHLPETQAAAEAIIRGAAQHDGSEPISDQARVDAKSGARELRVARDSAGTPVGVAVLGDGELDLVIDPAHRGQGHATRALEALLASHEGQLLAWAHGEQPAADRLLSRAGFSPVRTLLRLALDPARLPAPERPAAPEGFTHDTFAPVDATEWLRVNAAAFAHHPEQGLLTRDDLAARQEEPWFDAEDFLLLRPENAPDRIAGFAWLKVSRAPDGAGTTGEIYAIGVDPELAGRGLGRALMNAGLARLAAHRPDRVDLYVEGDNEPALGLYRSLGFTVDTRSQQWLRPTVTSA